MQRSVSAGNQPETLNDRICKTENISKAEISFVLSENSSFYVLELSWHKSPATILASTGLADSSTVDKTEYSDLESAITAIASTSIKRKLCVDTVAVKIIDESGYEFLSPQNDLFESVLDALTSAFQSTRVIAAELTDTQAIDNFGTQLNKLDKFKTSAWLYARGKYRCAELTSNKNGLYIYVYLRNNIGTFDGLSFRASNGKTAIAALNHFAHGSTLLVETILAQTNRESRGPAADELVLTDDPLLDICKATWKCAAGTHNEEKTIELNSTTNKSAVEFREEALRELLRTHLDAGPKGVSLWNRVPDAVKQSASFQGVNLTGRNLTGITAVRVDFQESNFDNTQMSKTVFREVNIERSSFVGADLSASKLRTVAAKNAIFTNCSLKNTTFASCDLQNAMFDDANIEGAEFKSCDLRGVDLTLCNADAAGTFAKTKYDETTKLPKNFSHWNDLQWSGNGADPLVLRQIQRAFIGKTVDFNEFIEQINRSFDPSRVSKALSMLKSESFELFSEQDEAGTMGIIKSQTNPDLVYACRLRSDGAFCCCTQNLNPCGGLRGALCKHILVLLIGLTKSGVLDPTESAKHVFASKDKAPSLDKAIMTSVFLRYKGAQAGELDWRPTETVPEDYYAF